MVGTPIIVVLWFDILRQVPGRTREGEVCPCVLHKRFGERETPGYAKAPATGLHADENDGNRDLLSLLFFNQLRTSAVGRRKGEPRPRNHHDRGERAEDLRRRRFGYQSAPRGRCSAQALDLGVLEQQGKPVEAGPWGQHCLDAGSTFRRGRSQPLLRARLHAIRRDCCIGR